MTLPIYVINISDIGFSSFPAVLRTHSLGSCVGILLYDSNKQHGGLIHAMLPSSSSINHTPGKFVVTAIPHLLQLFEQAGSKHSDLVSMIFGGSHMFTQTLNPPIGDRNIATTISLLHELHIPILMQHTGGQVARSLTFNTQSGEVQLSIKDEQLLFSFH